MKRMLLCAVLLLMICFSASASDRTVSLSFDTFLGIRLGAEVRFHPRMGVRADVGAAFYGVLLADAFYVFYLLPAEHRLRLNLLLGIPNASAPLTMSEAMISFGASFAFGYRLTDTLSLDLRLGAGFPLFFDPDGELIRPVKIAFFVPYLWPDLALSFNFALPARR